MGQALQFINEWDNLYLTRGNNREGFNEIRPDYRTTTGAVIQIW